MLCSWNGQNPVIAVVSPKGGQGKTTLAYELAALFSMCCERSLSMSDPLADMAAQAAARSGKAQRPPNVAPPQPRRERSPREAKATQGGGRVFAPRQARVQLWQGQEDWLREVVSDALRSGVRIGDSEVIRLAVARLQRDGRTWGAMKDELLEEKRARVDRQTRRQ